MSSDADRESKTEAPTEKRLADARQKGNSAFSPALPVMFSIAAMWLGITLLLGGAVLQVAAVLLPFLEQPGMWDLKSGTDAAELLRFVSRKVFMPILPLLLLLALFGVLGSAMQFGGIAAERIKPKLERVSLMAGWKRILGLSGLAYNSRAALKVLLVGAVAFWSLKGLTQKMVASGALDTPALSSVLMALLADMTRNLFVIIALVAIADAALARHKWLRDLRMTKQEIKDEAKEAEGDQAIKMRIRMLGRQRLKKRMMAAVPKATVVIANPTHYAVALRYVRSEGGAPRVVAKGRDSLALRIRSTAEQNSVPVVENKILARALYESVQVDAALPPEFYRAVAEIISVIMRRARDFPGHGNS